MRLLWKLFVLGCVFVVVGCDEPDAEELIAKESTIAEHQQGGTIFVHVEGDGEAQLVVKNSAKTVVTRGVEGRVVVSDDAGGAPTEVELKADPERGVFTAKLPPLDAPATTVTYALVMDGKTLKGSLVLPEGGTAELAEASVAKEDDLEKGERGGVVQEVAGAKMEVVADSSSGEVRVYPFDAAERPEKIELAVDVRGDSERIELEWDAEGYFVADFRPGWVPRKTTLIVTGGDADVHVALVGLRAGVVFDVTRRPVYWEHRKWKHRGLARGHYKGTRRGPPGHDDRGKKGKHDHGSKHDGGRPQVVASKTKTKVHVKGGDGDVKVKIHAK